MITKKVKLFLISDQNKIPEKINKPTIVDSELDLPSVDDYLKKENKKENFKLKKVTKTKPISLEVKLSKIKKIIFRF